MSKKPLKPVPQPVEEGPALRYQRRVATFAQRREQLGSGLKAKLHPAWKDCTAALNFLVVIASCYFPTLLAHLRAMQPFDFVYSATVYPIYVIGIFSFAVCISIMSVLGITKIASQNWDHGFNFVNWPNPKILVSKESVETVEAARAMLSQGTTSSPLLAVSGGMYVDLAVGAEITRFFSLDVAKAFVLLNALLHERDESKVQHAYEISINAQAQAKSLLDESDEKIRNQASVWGLEYETLSDTDSGSGSFAGVFYTKPDVEHPFMIVCFKGSPLTNVGKLLEDLTPELEPCNVFLTEGKAQTSHFNDLFPTSESTTDPYGRFLSPPCWQDSLAAHTLSRTGDIIFHLRTIAAQMIRKTSTESSNRFWQIPLWITGMGRGGALGSLLYARLLRVGIDLGPDLVLKDGYVFGSPRVADGDCASSFEQSLVTPLGRPTTLYRITLPSNLLSALPPGRADYDTSRFFLPSSSLLNFAHLGSHITLTNNVAPFVQVDPHAFHPSTKVIFVREKEGGRRDLRSHALATLGSEEENGEGIDLVGWAFALMPEWMFSHFPAAYYAKLHQVQGEQERESSVKAKEKGKGKVENGELRESGVDE